MAKDLEEPRTRSSTCRTVAILIGLCLSNFLDSALTCVLIPVLPAILMNGQLHINDTFNRTATPSVNDLTSDVYLSNVTANLSLLVDFPDQKVVPPVTSRAMLGLLFGVSGFVCFLQNPISGYIIDRSSPFISMFIGLILNPLSCLLYGFGQSYWAFFAASCINGCASSLLACGGLASVSTLFSDTKVRSRLTGFLNAFADLGASIGPAYGGAMHQFFGQQITFLALVPLWGVTFFFLAPLGLDYRRIKCFTRPKSSAEDESEIAFKSSSETNGGPTVSDHSSPNEMEVTIAAENGLIKASSVPIVDVTPEPAQVKPSPIYRLLMDPHILIASLVMVVMELCVTSLIPTLALWMRDKFGATEFQTGIVWIFGFVDSILGTLASMAVCHRFYPQRHLFVILAVTMAGFACLILPFLTQWYLVFIPLILLEFCLTFSENILCPHLANLVDRRHASIYGSISAIMTCNFDLSEAIGACLAGLVAEKIGFLYLNVGTFALAILVAPLLLISRKYFQ